MRKKSIQLFNIRCRACVCFAVVFGLFLSFSAHAQQQPTDLKKLEILKKSIEQLKAELKATQDARNDVLKTLEKTEQDIGELSDKAKQLERQRQQEQKKLNDLNQERSQLQQKKNEQQQHVGEYINAAYRVGQTNQLQLLLNQQSPADVSRTLTYYQYFVAARSEKIKAYITVIERLQALEPAIQASNLALSQKLEELKQKQQQLSKAQGQRKQTLAKLETELSTSQQKLKKLQQDRERLEAVVSRVSEYIGDVAVDSSGKSFDKLKGALPWPTHGRVISSYGSSRVANRISWEGIMIEANSGSDVKAVHAGRVVFSDYLRGHGLLIILDHGSGFMTLYAHNQSLNKELGEWVAAGDVISAVGNSGGQQRNALYFELRHNGKPTNPMPWLKRA